MLTIWLTIELTIGRESPFEVVRSEWETATVRVGYLQWESHFPPASNTSCSEGPMSLDDIVNGNYDDLILDACARFERNKDPDKEYIDCLLKLCNWLVNSKPPAATGWTGQRGNARKLNGEMEVRLQELAVGMISGTWWHKQLTGWTQFAACMISILHMCKDNVHWGKIDEIVTALVEEKDKMYNGLLKRELERWKDQGSCGPAPTLQDVKAAKSLDYGEYKWKSIEDYFIVLKGASKDNGPNAAMATIVYTAIRELQSCVKSETPPRLVLEMLSHLKSPPGFMSLDEVRERERTQRAKDAEHDDFDLDSSPEDEGPREETKAGSSRTSTPSPVLPIAPPAQLPAKKRAREDGPSEESERTGWSPDRREYEKLADMRDNIRGMIKSYGKLLHSFEYAGGNLDRNIGFAYADVNPFVDGGVCEYREL